MFEYNTGMVDTTPHRNKQINWVEPADVEKYVRSVLAIEADDIPQEKIDAGKWTLGEIQLNQIKVDRDMVKKHDSEDLHIGRRDNFVATIKLGKLILPLIVLGREKFLVDGYARYRALKEIGVDKAKVIFQDFDEDNQDTKNDNVPAGQG